MDFKIVQQYPSCYIMFDFNHKETNFKTRKGLVRADLFLNFNCDNNKQKLSAVYNSINS